VNFLRIAKRPANRPAHIHFIVAAPGYETLITQIFVKGDPEIEQDVVFTGNDELVGDFKQEGDRFRLVYDFPLRRGVSTTLKAPIPT
jgi:protocatechuate 3,4-dioxygenase beta subunit